MNENIQALLQKVAESEELQSRFAKVSTPEEAYEIAKEIQGGYTKEEFLEAAKALAEAMDEDIGDEDLASAAGGVDEAETQEAGVCRAAVAKTVDVCGLTNVTNSDGAGVVRSASVTVVTKSVLYRSEGKASKALAV